MPVPSLPFPRSPRDNDPLPARRGRLGAPSSTVDPDAASSTGAARQSVPARGELAPALLAQDGRGAVALLNEARDQAARLADGIEQLAAAGQGVARIQKLLGRLRNIAVVALDRGLHPADRATLQRQVGLMLSEIDAVADATTLDESLLRGGAATTSHGADEPRIAPFRALGSTALGIADLAVRSSDQALAAAGALDVASARLDRSAAMLSSATARLHEALDQITSPAATATGQAALGGATAALSATMTLRGQITLSPEQAIQTQTGPDVVRVKRLLDSSAW